MTKYIEKLCNSNLFKNVTKEEIEKFLSETKYIIKEYSPKEQVKLIDDYLIVIVSGIISKIYTDIDGNQTIANMYDCVEEYVILADATDTFCNMEYFSISNSLVLFLSREDMRKYNPNISEIKNKIYNNILSSIYATEKKSNLISVFISQSNVNKKLIKYVEFQKKILNDKKKFLVTKRELSNLLNIDYSSLCREINKLSETIPDIESYFATEVDVR